MRDNMITFRLYVEKPNAKNKGGKKKEVKFKKKIHWGIIIAVVSDCNIKNH